MPLNRADPAVRRACALAGVALALAAHAALAAGASNAGAGGRYVETGGSRLYVQTSGQGPVLVFLHGGLGSFDTSFPAQKAYFSAFRQVVGIDQRGHGHSPDNDQPFSYGQMAEDTAAVIRALGVGPVDIVGHSDGGNVGLLLARRHPELVRRLVISGANARGDFDGTLAYLRSRLQSSASFGAALPPDMRAAYERTSPDGASHWPTMVAKTKDLWETRIVIDDEDLHAIGIPVLVMAGDHDAIPLAETARIFRALPNGQLCILPATGHNTMGERPEEFNRIVQVFLGEGGHN